ncbi:TonB-dependent receptor [Piscinibacter gummiphilus]|uniref:TonB-dependent receptor n=1 Tax=Piscinibacter gummiphilus TaxID=946333 RepID=A0ABZ0CSV3_9BURK|nr:TonB-dependent receptor [Piscinibacter gummiphilus]WOB07596.1 TonB-dependent receptor [Piscinibacter gummiphilus]
MIALAVAAAAANAQTPPPPPAPSPAPAPAPAPAPQQLERVEITGTRNNDQSERRQSTAAKIVIGREEIERFGDSTVGEVLKRLPGITLQGAPGRGGAIRMRGLGSGYTQILIDGERVPPGLTIDTLTPEQIERIEILRAPTAETGARAIAGTINIVTREGFKKRLNDLRVGFGVETGHVHPGFSWTRNDSVDNLIYNFSLSAFKFKRDTESVTTTVREAAIRSESVETTQSTEERTALHATGRLQWRGDKGTSLVLMPLLIASETDNTRNSRIDQTPLVAKPYDTSTGHNTGRYQLLRLNSQFNRGLEGVGRLELKGGLGQGRWSGRAQRYLRNNDGSPTLAQPSDFDDVNSARDTNATLGSKLTTLLPNDHALVAGAEVEHNRRNEQHSEADVSGDDFSARSLRLAAFAQDEWNLTPQWAVHAGLRWESIRTQGEANGLAAPFDNRSSVWTPLLHTVWKFDPKSRDQVRMSLTRSYRSPTLQNLIPYTRQSQPNSETRPDRAGNPDLKPELATGLDVAIERYLPGSGILSASVFHREISQYIRTVTSLEGTRYVSRMQNVGDATTQGLELEAKFRLSDLVADAPGVELRANGGVFRSKVKGTPGPDNRIDQQASGVVNLGADYRFRRTGLTLGGNLSWQPGYTTRISDTQWVIQGKKTVVDAFMLYAFNPGLQLRISGSNLAARDYLTGSRFEGGTVRETTETDTNSYISWQVRLEMKL